MGRHAEGASGGVNNSPLAITERNNQWKRRQKELREGDYRAPAGPSTSECQKRST